MDGYPMENPIKGILLHIPMAGIPQEPASQRKARAGKSKTGAKKIMINEEQQARIGAAEGVLSPNDHVVEILPLDQGASWIQQFSISLSQRLRDATPTAIVAASDFCCLLIAGQLAIFAQHLLTPAQFGLQFSARLPLYCILMVFSYAAVGLYSGITRSSPDELRRLTLATTALALIIATVTYISHGSLEIGLGVYLFAWLFTLFTIPLGRAGVRTLFGRREWWGRKAVIFAHDLQTARRVVKSLCDQPRLALKPVAVLATSMSPRDQWDLGLPLLPSGMPGILKAKLQGINHAIIAMPDLNDPEGLVLIRRYEFMFKHWTIVPYFAQNYSLWVRTQHLNGLLGLELTHRLLVPSHQMVKRAVDIVLTLIGSIVMLPVCLLIAFAIKIDSRGPVLYKQTRLGKGGKPFGAFKFRSMVKDADKILAGYLDGHPELREEWDATQKLKDDPRTTAFGRFLRRTSLDELPQLLNVLRGEMSLVGPRPCMPDQRFMYEWAWDFYRRVRPGITGHWQISGRNGVSFRERTLMDAYYIRNWSVWLDIYILARTIPTVMRRNGAY